MDNQTLRDKLLAIIDEPMDEQNMEAMLDNFSVYTVDKMLPIIEADKAEAVREARINELARGVEARINVQGRDLTEYTSIRYDELRSTRKSED